MSGTGYGETVALLALAAPPTAMFACSDQMALGAYEALYERGMRVPDDMSIVGFDDLDEARWAIPPLTTVRQPLAEMAGMATRMLLALIAGEALETDRGELATPLVARIRTRALAASSKPSNAGCARRRPLPAALLGPSIRVRRSWSRWCHRSGMSRVKDHLGTAAHLVQPPVDLGDLGRLRLQPSTAAS